MKDKHVNQNVEVVVLPTAVKATYRTRETRKIQQAVMDKLLLTSKEPYHKVQVAVKHRADGSPEALVAYMLRAYTYTADIARVTVDAQYGVRSVEVGIGGDEETYAGIAPSPVSAGRVSVKPKAEPDMVFGTPVPEIPTAKAGVEYACKVAAMAGYSVVKLLGANASVANYSRYLTCHLRAFGNIGHGYTGGIVLSDGNLTSGRLSSLAKKALWPEVIYFNSCQTFNPPLQPSIMKAGARTFVGGKVNLLIGESEEVFKCFWTRVLRGAWPMGKALTTCEKENYPTRYAHGISGDVGKFKPIPR